jgi:hypothetical protein
MRMTSFMTEDIFNLREVADYLKVIQRTIYRLPAPLSRRCRAVTQSTSPIPVLLPPSSNRQPAV